MSWVRTALQRRAFSALPLALSASMLISVAAHAKSTPTLAETMSFARSEINRFCDSEDLSWFDEIDERPVNRSCRATLNRSSLSMLISFQHENHASAGSAAGPRPLGYQFHAGRRQVDIQFDTVSNFLCGPPQSNGYAPLYLNCIGESAISDKRCAIERTERWGDGGHRNVVQKARSFSLLFNVRVEDCKMLRNALNFVVRRTPPTPRKEVRDYFSE